MRKILGLIFVLSVTSAAYAAESSSGLTGAVGVESGSAAPFGLYGRVGEKSGRWQYGISGGGGIPYTDANLYGSYALDTSDVFRVMAELGYRKSISNGVDRPDWSHDVHGDLILSTGITEKNRLRLEIYGGFHNRDGASAQYEGGARLVEDLN